MAGPIDRNRHNSPARTAQQNTQASGGKVISNPNGNVNNNNNTGTGAGSTGGIGGGASTSGLLKAGAAVGGALLVGGAIKAVDDKRQQKSFQSGYNAAQSQATQYNAGYVDGQSKASQQVYSAQYSANAGSPSATAGTPSVTVAAYNGVDISNLHVDAGNPQEVLLSSYNNVFNTVQNFEAGKSQVADVQAATEQFKQLTAQITGSSTGITAAETVVDTRLNEMATNQQSRQSAGDNLWNAVNDLGNQNGVNQYKAKKEQGG